MDASLYARANQILQICDRAQLSVLDADGYPHASTVTPIRPENMLEAFFATGLGANKTQRLLRDPRASVCYSVGGNNITLVGRAIILTDQPTKTQCWLDEFIHHFPGGDRDPNYCIIHFTTQRVSLWVDQQSAEFTMDSLLTVQSRCGLLCHDCSFQQSHNCGGCIPTNGHPFHGQCPVATCCQDKGHAHCGQCDQLPSLCANPDCDKVDANACHGCPSTSCDKLYPYSYKDPDHGDNPPGARVAVCKIWAKASGSC